MSARFMPLLLLLLAFGLRLYRLDRQSIWWDEGHSIFVANHPIPQIPTLPAMDVHPPAYFALLHLWMEVAGRSEFALRYLSVIFSLLTVALLWRFAGSISATLQFGSRSSFRASPQFRLTAPLLASFLAAISPLYVAYAQEVRSYALITFLALASTFLLWQILFAPANRIISSRRGLLLLYVTLTAASLYTHYFTIFLLLFQNLFWLGWIYVSSKKRRARLWLWFAAQLGILLLFAPQLLLALRQVTSYTNPNLVPPSLTQFITRSWQAYTVGLTIGPDLARWGMALMAGLLLIGWLLRLATGHPRLVTQFGFLALWLLIPLVAYFVVLQRQPSFEPRYMMLITPALFLLLALGLNQAFAIKRAVENSALHASGFTLSFSVSTQSILLYALPSIAIAVFIIGLYSYYTNEAYFKDDSAGVADWLARETTDDDIVYIDVPHPFHYYADQKQIPAPTRYLFVDIHTAADVLRREAASRDRLYWVTWHGSDTDPRGVIPFLAEKYGQQLGQLDFRGYRVRWYSLPDGNSGFELPTALRPVEATFGDVLQLDGVAHGGQPPTSPTVAPGESGWAALHFTLLRNTQVDYRVSLRLRGENGQLASQVDKDLLNDRHFRTSAWPVKDPALNQAINVYTLPVEPDTPPGPYRLEVILYNARPPYPSEGVTGHESDDGVAAIIGEIIVERSDS